MALMVLSSSAVIAQKPKATAVDAGAAAPDSTKPPTKAADKAMTDGWARTGGDKTANTVADKVADDRAAQLMETLRKQHKGAGPCYRWDRKSAVSPASISAAANVLSRSVTSDEVASVVPVFIKWADELEAKAHALSERDEFMKVVKDLAPPDEKAKLEKNPKALTELADKIVAKPVEMTKAQVTFNKLSKQKQKAVKDAFAQHAPSLRLSFIDVVVEMKKNELPRKVDTHDDGHGH